MYSILQMPARIPKCMPPETANGSLCDESLAALPSVPMAKKESFFGRRGALVSISTRNRERKLQKGLCSGVLKILAHCSTWFATVSCLLEKMRQWPASRSKGAANCTKWRTIDAATESRAGKTGSPNRCDRFRLSFRLDLSPPVSTRR